MRAIFMGTPEFAVPCLQTVAQEHELLGVVTQPDSRQGRGHKLCFSPVKLQALSYNVPILQPIKLREAITVNTIKDLQPEVIIVVAYGQKIPKILLELPAKGCINVHSSLLPKYRGAAPIQYAILKGEKETGVSTMYLSQQWDAGDIILQDKEVIYPDDTAGSLHDRLSLRGACLLSQTLKQLSAGVAPRIPQNHEAATYAFKLTKEQGAIDWTKTADELQDFVRGMNPWPTAYTYYNEETIKLWETEILRSESSKNGHPGEIVNINDHGICIATGSNGTIIVKQLQRRGSRKLSGKDFANGLRLKIGDRLGKVDSK